MSATVFSATVRTSSLCIGAVQGTQLSSAVEG